MVQRTITATEIRKAKKNGLMKIFLLALLVEYY
jgi:hypothetical protein